MDEKRKVKVGKVVSDKMDKTAVVAIQSLKRHPLYKKTIRRTVRFKAHDEANACRIGDIVTIVDTRPLSKTKRWKVVDIVSHRQALPETQTDVQEEVE